MKNGLFCALAVTGLTCLALFAANKDDLFVSAAAAKTDVLVVKPLTPNDWNALINRDYRTEIKNYRPEAPLTYHVGPSQIDTALAFEIIPTENETGIACADIDSVLARAERAGKNDVYYDVNTEALFEPPRMIGLPDIPAFEVFRAEDLRDLNDDFKKQSGKIGCKNPKLLLAFARAENASNISCAKIPGKTNPILRDYADNDLVVQIYTGFISKNSKRNAHAVISHEIGHSAVYATYERNYRLLQKQYRAGHLDSLFLKIFENQAACYDEYQSDSVGAVIGGNDIRRHFAERSVVGDFSMGLRKSPDTIRLEAPYDDQLASDHPKDKNRWRNLWLIDAAQHATDSTEKKMLRLMMPHNPNEAWRLDDHRYATPHGTKKRAAVVHHPK